MKQLSIGLSLWLAFSFAVIASAQDACLAPIQTALADGVCDWRESELGALCWLSGDVTFTANADAPQDSDGALLTDDGTPLSVGASVSPRHVASLKFGFGGAVVMYVEGGYSLLYNPMTVTNLDGDLNVLTVQGDRTSPCLGTVSVYSNTARRLNNVLVTFPPEGSFVSFINSSICQMLSAGVGVRADNNISISREGRSATNLSARNGIPLERYEYAQDGTLVRSIVFNPHTGTGTVTTNNGDQVTVEYDVAFGDAPAEFSPLPEVLENVVFPRGEQECLQVFATLENLFVPLIAPDALPVLPEATPSAGS
jgi:hypothetical protein